MATTHQAHLADIARRDTRYACDAYEFLFEALTFTQSRLGRGLPANADEAGPEHHVSGAELVNGYLGLAKLQFGRMARTVFKMWGINSTRDIGEIVFNLIDEGLLGKAENDCKSHFDGLCDLDAELVDNYKICWDDS